MHFGVNALITKPAEQLPAIIGALILMITGYIQGGNAYMQPESAINGLKFMAAVVPLFFIIIILLSQVIHPLKGDYLKRMKQEVLDLHKLKEAQIKENPKQ